MRILITGGAGFIGCHLTRHLLAVGHNVTTLDSFSPQVHNGTTSLPADIANSVKLVRGDVADLAVLKQALEGADAVAHLAAETGTGQSMYEVALYGRTNLMGSANLYELLTKGVHQVKRIVVASSRSIYGEGAYDCPEDGLVYPSSRTSEEKKAGIFEPLCPKCSGPCVPALTPESCPLRPASFYGFTKQAQEQIALLFGNVLKIPTVALRYQNVFGAGQSLQNPYTGILAIFSNLARTGLPLQIFEDGEESRDFIYVADVVKATAKALLEPIEGSHAINIGSGISTSVNELANAVNVFYGAKSELKVTGRFREGDIRHGVADLTIARKILDFEPEWSFADGLHQFLSWANESAPSTEGYERSLGELSSRGLLHDRK
jgi:dTDP-L-rhamnose 4-epimerase